MQIFALPAYAALSDRIGRRPVMIAGCIAAIVAVYPILLLIASGSVLGVLLGFLIAMPLVQAAMYGPLAAFTTEIFATGNRYTGASLGYQLSSTLGGGFAPLIAATLVAGTTAGNGLLRVALFAAAAALISAITIAVAKESSRRTLVDHRLTARRPPCRDSEDPRVSAQRMHRSQHFGVRSFRYRGRRRSGGSTAIAARPAALTALESSGSLGRARVIGLAGDRRGREYG